MVTTTAGNNATSRCQIIKKSRAKMPDAGLETIVDPHRSSTRSSTKLPLLWSPEDGSYVKQRATLVAHFDVQPAVLGHKMLIGVGGAAKETRKLVRKQKGKKSVGQLHVPRVRAEIRLFGDQNENKTNKHRSCRQLKRAHCGGPMLKMSKPP